MPSRCSDSCCNSTATNTLGATDGGNPRKRNHKPRIFHIPPPKDDAARDEESAAFNTHSPSHAEGDQAISKVSLRQRMVYEPQTRSTNAELSGYEPLKTLRCFLRDIRLRVTGFLLTPCIDCDWDEDRRSDGVCDEDAKEIEIEGLLDADEQEI